MAETIEQLTEARDAALLRVETAALARQVQALEIPDTPLLEAFGQLIDPRERLWSAPPGSGYDLRIDQLGDRQGGIYRPVFETEQDLAEQRGVAQWLTASDETAIGILTNRTNYVLGTGLTYEATAKDDNCPPKLIKAVQDVIDEFQEANRWRRREREAVERDARDGEVMLCLDPAYTPRLKIENPHGLTEPRDVMALNDAMGEAYLDWSFGIACQPGDTELPLAYHFADDPAHTSWRIRYPHHVQHLKRNVDFGIKRGVSDFYAAAAEVEQAAKLARNTAEGAAIQATIAYIKEMAAGTSGTQVAAARTASTDWTDYQPTPNGNKPTHYEKFNPGRVITTSAKYHAGPMGTSMAPTFIDVLQMVLRRVGNRWCMPEYMVSGDASNANYSSTLVAESPFVKYVEAERADYVEEFEELHWKMLAIAEKFNRFADYVSSLAELKRLVKINITGPDIATRNRREETEIRAILSDKGILSDKTFAAEEDLDYEAEQQQGAQRHETLPAYGVGGPAPLPTAMESVTADEVTAFLEGAYP